MNKPKKTVVYHSADFDGIFSREIAKHFMPDAELIGWDYGNPKLDFPDEGTVYIIDLSPECFNLTTDNLMMRKGGGFDGNAYRCVWIDHHKSAIDKFSIAIPGYRIDGVAACRLAWQWFKWEAQGLDPHRNQLDPALPTKDEYFKRSVSEPLAVRLAGEYDIWDKRDPDAEVFQMGLRSVPIQMLDFEALLKPNALGYIDALLSKGHLIQDYQQRNDVLAMNNSFVVEFEGLKFLSLNTQAKSSLAFKSKDVPETGHDALLKFCWNGTIWDCSMYHAKHRTDLDLSQIAVKNGGGGHRGACGFRTATLPFIPQPLKQY